ncbi:MAG: flavin-containing monooxygenase, partial [Rubrivivax sp.]
MTTTPSAISPRNAEASHPLAASPQLAPQAGPPPRHEVVILGAGMSGLCVGIELQRAGLHDFLILEMQAGVGGTWWDNCYPGAHVDVPAPLYSFSFEPNPRWRQRFAAAHEIQAYMAHCADKYGLRPHLRLGVKITAARFDDTEGWWTLDTQGPEGHRQILTRFFVCSTGPLSQVRWPDIPGLDHFQGRKLHSARWDPACAIQGQRVAVIGTGSTASQLIPPLAQQATQLHVFQRTANWVLPRIDRPYFAVDRLLARFPPYAWAVRTFWYHLLEWGRRGFDEGTMARRGMLKTAALHLRRQVPDPALRAKLRPPYPLGCKRIIYSNDFDPALSQPSVELVTEAIERITPTGIVTTDGRERPIDTLVCA